MAYLVTYRRECLQCNISSGKIHSIKLNHYLHKIQLDIPLPTRDYVAKSNLKRILYFKKEKCNNCGKEGAFHIYNLKVDGKNIHHAIKPNEPLIEYEIIIENGQTKVNVDSNGEGTWSTYMDALTLIIQTINETPKYVFIEHPVGYFIVKCFEKQPPWEVWMISLIYSGISKDRLIDIFTELYKRVVYNSEEHYKKGLRK